MIWMWNTWNLYIELFATTAKSWWSRPLLNPSKELCCLLKERRSDPESTKLPWFLQIPTAWAPDLTTIDMRTISLTNNYIHMEWRLTPCATTGQWKDYTAAFEVQPLNLHMGMVWAWGCSPRGQLTCEDSDSLCVNAIGVGLKHDFGLRQGWCKDWSWLLHEFEDQGFILHCSCQRRTVDWRQPHVSVTNRSP